MISQGDCRPLIQPPSLGPASSTDTLSAVEPRRPVALPEDRAALEARPNRLELPAAVRAGKQARSAASGVFALADQFVVSGTSFVTTVIVGRACGADGLGLYVLAATVLVVIVCAQESLVLTPYTVYCHRLGDRERARYAGSVLVHHGTLAALVTALLAACAVVMATVDPRGLHAAVTGGLAAVVPFALFRDFVRRFEFAHLRMSAAFMLDVAVAVLQIGGLAAAAWMGSLTPWSAFAVIGISCAAATAGWLGLARPKFEFCRIRIVSELHGNWRFGRWVFAALMTLMFQLSVIPWLLALMHGTHATGFYAACAAVVMLVSPVTQGVSNLLVPRAAQAFAEGGRAAVRGVVAKTTWLMALAMVPPCVAVMLIGPALVQMLYGQQYADCRIAITVLALAVLVRALGMPAYNGLRVMERPAMNFWANLLGLLTTLAACLLLVASWDVLGAACALLAGDIVGNTVRWGVFLRRESDFYCKAIAT